ncbi:MAG: hypothetical protein V3R89_09150, partial [Thermoanaerobaculia bacterium]
MLAGITALVLAAALPGALGAATSESPVPAAPVPRQLWVEVIDAAGDAAAAETGLRFEVVEAGRRYAARDLGTVGGAWRVVLYLDQLLAAPLDFHNA